MAKEQGDFKCRLCGHTECKKVSDNNGIRGPGGRSWVLYYYCGGCTVRFSDPAKFSVASDESSG